MPAQLPTAVARSDTRRVLVGFSGGLDSSVLLHLLAQDANTRQHGLRAIHIHHGLQPAAEQWGRHCETVCSALGVPLRVVSVEVDTHSPLGLEGAARSARHAAFAQALGEDEILALAHHQDDQAETFLLRALRGSGVDGLAAMQPWRAFPPGWLWRPLLATPRATLHAYAQTHALQWIEDPSNASIDADRNFLRNAVLPLLAQRWPQSSSNLARSSFLCAQASGLLQEDDHAALAQVQLSEHTLSVTALTALTAARRARVLRLWTATLGLPPLPSHGVAQIETTLLTAAADAQARFHWQDASVQRWRDLLHAQVLRPALPTEWATLWDGKTPLPLPSGDTLELHSLHGFERPVRVHARRGGERITLPGRTHSHSLKHVLQQYAVPPWQRERLPLLSSHDGELLAAGDHILSASMAAWLHQHSARLFWRALA